MTHDVAHAFARRVVGDLAETNPAHYILSAQASRRGRIFLDYLRNGTVVGTYSPRVRHGFQIAAPVTWNQIEAGIAPDSFSMDHPFRVRHDAARLPVQRCQ
jgi:bifunctional non-homologous end joining protein LigD